MYIDVLLAFYRVTVIEAVGRELIKENDRVVGVRYHKKRDDAKKVNYVLMLLSCHFAFTKSCTLAHLRQQYTQKWSCKNSTP